MSNDNARLARNNRRHRKKKAKNGICLWCSRPAAEGMSLCLIHGIKNKLQQRKMRCSTHPRPGRPAGTKLAPCTP